MTDDIRDEDLKDEQLVVAARQLGVQAAGRLDMERTARGVIARWRAEQARARTPLAFWRSGAMLRVAAAVVLLVAGIETWEHEQHRKQQAVATALVPGDAGLEGLSPDQLQAVLPAVDQSGDAEATAGDAGLEGLTSEELRSVLSSMGS